MAALKKEPHSVQLRALVGGLGKRKPEAGSSSSSEFMSMDDMGPNDF